jgi:hypothetical protein
VTDLRLEMLIPFIASRNPALGPPLGGGASSASAGTGSAILTAALGADKDSEELPCADTGAAVGVGAGGGFTLGRSYV